MQIKNRKYYETLFRPYPDLVTIDQFRKMLGGIGNGTARKLLQENSVRHFMIRRTYLIPKTYIVDYVLSDQYNTYKKTLQVEI